MEEIEQQVEFLSNKVDRALGAISATWSALSTGATWQRIHGAILVPASVGTGVITDNAITETKIDSLAVSTPKLQANSITAAKLEANLVLSTKIIGGTYTAPNTFGVELSNAGLKLFDGGGVQRGWMKTDGSGWLGSTTAFSWDTAGAVTATGITVATAGGAGARVTLDSTGLKMYNASNQRIWELIGGTGMRWYNATGVSQRGELNADGTGWMGVSSTQGLTWDNGGNVTMTSATFRSGSTTAKVQVDASGLHVFNASGVKTGYFSPSGDGFMGSTAGTAGTAAISWSTAGTATINATSVTTGSLNGTLLSAGSVGDSAVASLSANKITAGSGIINALTVANTLTLGTGGKIIDADGSFWDSTGIVLISSGLFGDSIKWRSGGIDRGSVYYVTNNMIFAYSSGGSCVVGSGSASLLAPNGSNGLAISNSGTSHTGTFASTGVISTNSGVDIKSGGRFYPSNGSTYYIDAGVIQSNGIGIGGMLGISTGNTINFVAPGTGGSASNWSSFTTANIPDKSAGYFTIQIAGVNYRVPFYANA